MLETCGFTYDSALDAYRNGKRLLRVDSILRHSELWVAEWITETLPTWDVETAPIRGHRARPSACDRPSDDVIRQAIHDKGRPDFWNR
jgi:hypothetical protein